MKIKSIVRSHFAYNALPTENRVSRLVCFGTSKTAYTSLWLK